MAMNQEAFEGRWKQVRDHIRVWWDKLSDNDVDQIAGRYGHLISALEEKYGYTRPQAEVEVARRMERRAARKPEPEQ